MKRFTILYNTLFIFVVLFGLNAHAGIKLNHGDNVFSSTLAIGKTTAADSKAAFEVVSTTKGMLPPRMTTTQRDNISSPSTGLTIYNTTTNALNVYSGSAWVAALVNPAIATGDIFYQSSTGSIDRKAPGIEGQFVVSGGPGAGPLITFGSTTASITSNRNINCSDTVVRADSSGGSFTLTLPSAATCPSKILRFVLTAAGSNAGLKLATTGGQTIGGLASLNIIMNTANDTLEVASDGTNWQITNWGIKVGIRYKGQPANVINGSNGTTYPTVVTDPNSDFSSATFTARYAGYYDISTGMFITITTGSFVGCFITKNGSSISGNQLPFPSTFSNSISCIVNLNHVYLAAGDTISTVATGNGSPAWNSNADYSWLSISMVSR